jgi:hypothetical protein
MRGLIFNLHRETTFLSRTHNVNELLAGAYFLQEKMCSLTWKGILLLMVANLHPPVVPCLKSTAFMPLALPSPSHPLSANRTFIYKGTTLTCPLLLSGIQTWQKKIKNGQTFKKIIHTVYDAKLNKPDLNVSLGVKPGYIVFPSKKYLCTVLFGILLSSGKLEKCLAVCWVWAWWPLASIVLTICFLITWLGNVW